MKWFQTLKYLGWSIPGLLVVTIFLHQSVRTQQPSVVDSSDPNNSRIQEIPVNQENMISPDNSIEEEIPTPEVIPPETSPEQPSIGKTPKELGENYIPMVQKARESVSRLQPTMQIKFPLGVNQPILINPEIERRETPLTNPNNTENNTVSQQMEIIGIVDSSGKPKAITPNDLLEMFDFHLSGLNSENLSSALPNKVMPVVDEQDVNPQSQNVLVLDIIVLDKITQKIYSVPNVVVIGVLRDALNAALNNTISPNNYNVSQLRLDLNPPAQPNPSTL